MKQTQTCPKCSCRRFLVTDEYQVPRSRSDSALAAISVTVPIAGVPHATTTYSVGTVEQWICAQCGYMELYARGLAAFDLAKAAGGVRYVDAAPVGPFR